MFILWKEYDFLEIRGSGGGFVKIYWFFSDRVDRGRVFKMEDVD